MSTATPADQKRRQNRATAGAFVGTAIEWYDFFIFGTAAALVFGKVFFPDATPAVGILASFATFWVGFLARPLGGAFFGHLGDKFGRKNTLVATLFLMGTATTLIGVLPGYATIGVAAPVLLVILRACQGLAVGGEWAGAALMATESASAKKKGLAGAWVQQGSPAGSILATLMFLVVGGLPDDAFLSWGWRIPFLFSAVLVLVGLLIRLKVEESQDFMEAKAQQEVVKVPIVEVFRKAPAFVWLGVAASVLGIAVAFFNNTFLLSWTTSELGMPRQTVLNVLLIMAVLQFIWQPLAALLAERIGAVRVMIGGLVLNLLVIVPMFLAIMSTNAVLIAVVLGVATLGGTAYYAMLASFLTSAFPANVRYTGVALANGLCASLIGGSTPLIAQFVLTSVGPWGVAAFYAVIAVVTVGGVWGLHRRIVRRDTEAAVLEPAAR
ncbi:MHS family MFS transporter [Arthrobacter sp. Sa2CUA1]|uniref:MHS family MFS transporter n=1 Tax=Arthrobacter gallicola TaxID=2762225 RepID=A0ABR8UUL7_9MICC|nr:MFS transporter [Arthrobacter gallicola]MBD7996232.1 MHS family MFS transporter [Arthrobacter gallicola]